MNEVSPCGVIGGLLCSLCEKGKVKKEIGGKEEEGNREVQKRVGRRRR